MAYPQTQCGEGQRKEDGGGGSLMSIGQLPLVTEEKKKLCNIAVLTMQHSTVRRTVNHLYLQWY